MEAFSNLLLSLYRLAQNAPLAEFQTRALDQVREALPFDSAIWVTGGMTQQGGIPHTIHVYHQPPDMMENWERIKQHDVLNFEAFSRLGQTINAALSIDPYWQPRIHPAVTAHIKRYGMEHILATIIAEPVLRLFSAVSFYRANPEQPFTESERLFKQNLMPHLAETCNNNRFNFLHLNHKDGAQLDHARAICDVKGVLYNADQNLEKLMLAEWQDWQGPILPQVLLNAIFEQNGRKYIGQRTVSTIRPLNDMLMLSLRRKSAVDQLSPRELEIARHFGHGMDHRSIAHELHISPSTVRNHLQSIYSTLGISNKIEMALIILDAENYL